MILAELLDGLDGEPFEANATAIKGIALDSRKVKKDFVFIAVAGAVEHGLVYARQAIENGAFAVVYEPKGSEGFALEQFGSCTLAVKELALKLGCIADRFYQSPSKKMDVIGVTGTNGKTTCSQFLQQLLPESGVIGTLGWGENGSLVETLNTTPDALDVQQILARFAEEKKKVAIMEVSSHGLEKGRVNAVNFKGAVFTNLSRDHLDYHGTMEAYLNAKLILFKRPELQFAVVNTDDDNSEKFLNAAQSHVKRWAFSAKGSNSKLAENVIADEISYSLNGIDFFVCWQNHRAFVQTKIVGDFNLENILAVIAVLLAQGFSLDEAASKTSKLTAVAGRMERFGGEDKPVAFVDYAHTPDALEKVLLGLRKYCSQTLWLVFGCGGNRDKGKRAQMGAVAEKIADRVVVTDDNPRLESSEQIINDILAGFNESEYEVIQNREQAIQNVIKQAGKQDCIVIAGKGHESYQDIKGVKQMFSDQEVVQQALLERAK
jgi:UDP-N-acetylmuramoyl-L-alanyl-D-glutamate--2,6-diaminopimelate ligase